MDDVVIVAGAGRAGLCVARALASRGLRITIVERLPVCGGQEPERPQVDELTIAALDAGATVIAGTMAVAWDGESVATLGIRGAVSLRAGTLVVATGTRPATTGELGIAGDRCAGVLPGSAALHLIENGVLPGRNPVVLGGGSLAESCVNALRKGGAAHITLVAPDGVGFPCGNGDLRVIERWTVDAVHGPGRVASLTISTKDACQRVLADALILAHRRVPMRNIEGAVYDRPRVVFCHTAKDPKSEADLEETVGIATRGVLQIVGHEQMTTRRLPVETGQRR